ncbi:hypothetical protein Ddye_005030 [Dipteronia dyeriana]|uniref:Uncharacterized protein n=1 Tax=Dipteronia dyeriana TaxID=168575 RepID=A0AAE0CPB5_9ROSI|nr:hypothetical protein Ddye_005030 [Dipteronia dyeriana]
MDNSSFPKVLKFRNKLPPSPQLLRLKDWFSRYDFTVPYHYNPHTKLLWTSNTSYEWDTSYDYERLYPLCIQIPLLNFLCDVNNDATYALYILPSVPRDPSLS